MCVENRVLRRIFGPKRDEVTGEWKNYTMRSLMLCTRHPIFRVIKPRRMRWMGHLAHMGGEGGRESRVVYRVFGGET